ncbi:MAG: DUF5915 domain-containing protein, partial [Planctomycetes bacterium]|nr:DUF5915 domain-containing protein [Planctomycetota bacterium]
LGPRVGKLMPQVKQALSNTDGGRLLAELNRHGKVALDIAGRSIELDTEDIQVRLQAKEGWAAAQGDGDNCVVVLNTELTPQLVREGLVRDLVRLVNERRKELECDFTDRIRLGIITESEELRTALAENEEYVKGETLAVEVMIDQPLADVEAVENEIAKTPVTIYVQTVPV